MISIDILKKHSLTKNFFKTSAKLKKSAVNPSLIYSINVLYSD